ncbi:unnamed protein product [Mortierella alpina]
MHRATASPFLSPLSRCESKLPLSPEIFLVLCFAHRRLTHLLLLFPPNPSIIFSVLEAGCFTLLFLASPSSQLPQFFFIYSPHLVPSLLSFSSLLFSCHSASPGSLAPTPSSSSYPVLLLFLLLLFSPSALFLDTPPPDFHLGQAGPIPTRFHRQE